MDIILKELVSKCEISYDWDAGNDSIVIKYSILAPSKDNPTLYSKPKDIYELINVFKNLNINEPIGFNIDNCNMSILNNVIYDIFYHTEDSFNKLVNSSMFVSDFLNKLYDDVDTIRDYLNKIKELTGESEQLIELMVAGLYKLEELKYTIIIKLELPETTSGYYENGSGVLRLDGNDLVIVYDNNYHNDEYLLDYIWGSIVKKVAEDFKKPITNYYNNVTSKIPSKFFTDNEIHIDISQEKGIYSSSIGFYRNMFDINEELKPLITFIKTASGLNNFEKAAEVSGIKIDNNCDLNEYDIYFEVDKIIIFNNDGDINFYLHCDEDHILNIKKSCSDLSSHLITLQC